MSEPTRQVPIVAQVGKSETDPAPLSRKADQLKANLAFARAQYQAALAGRFMAEQRLVEIQRDRWRVMPYEAYRSAVLEKVKQGEREREWRILVEKAEERLRQAEARLGRFRPGV